MNLNDVSPASQTEPKLGWGEIYHERFRPSHNQFTYQCFFIALPMRSCRAQNNKNLSLARNRRALISFYDKDHGDGRDDSLSWLDELLLKENILDAQGEIWLQTFPRMCGYVFKPVSFWYCYTKNHSLRAIVAEVNNTFGERHCYILDQTAHQWGDTINAKKVFHVSPFCQVKGHYQFRFYFDMQRVLSRIDYFDQNSDDVLINTRISGNLQPLTAAELRKALFALPVMTLMITARIHWQALRLWVKRVPFHPKPNSSANIQKISSVDEHQSQ